MTSTPRLKAIEYMVFGDPDRWGLDDVRIYLTQPSDGSEKWIARHEGRYLTRAGKWEHEPPVPSEWNGFLASCRFDSPEAAAQAVVAARAAEPQDGEPAGELDVFEGSHLLSHPIPPEWLAEQVGAGMPDAPSPQMLHALERHAKQAERVEVRSVDLLRLIDALQRASRPKP